MMRSQNALYSWLAGLAAQNVSIQVMAASEKPPFQKAFGKMRPLMVEEAEVSTVTCYATFDAALTAFVCSGRPHLQTSHFLLTLGITFPDLPDCTSVEGRMHALVGNRVIYIRPLSYEQRKGLLEMLPYTIFMDPDLDRVRLRFEGSGNWPDYDDRNDPF